MTKKLKLSPWHDGNVKPVHVGFYQRNWFDFNPFYDFDAYYAYWDGEKWKYSSADWETAIKNSYDDIFCPQQKLSWRGILK